MADSDADDAKLLARLGYAQELVRCLGGFSNFAISLSIICILAGGITSFHVGFDSVGGASIGIGWPLVSLFALAVAATMGQLASAFPTAGGLYHWAAILGGRGAGWATAWFNLLGLITVLAAINVGMVRFVAGAFLADPLDLQTQAIAVTLVTLSQAFINHRGIEWTRRLTDFSGWWILGISILLVIVLLASISGWDFSRLITFTNFSGLPKKEGVDPTWEPVESMIWLFALGFLLPAYTITGFDASAHVSEETHDAPHLVPRGILRSVAVSGLFGWILLSAIVLAIPDMKSAAEEGDGVFYYVLKERLPSGLARGLFVAIAFAQYLCGLATVTSTSRVAFAFARDGGMPFSNRLRKVSPRHRSPVLAIWVVSLSSILFTIYTPVYATITAVCTVFLYISYVLPTAIGAWNFSQWKSQVGPWNLGHWYRPLSLISVLGCVGLIVIGMQPPNDRAVVVVGGMAVLLTAVWYGYARKHFPGPPIIHFQEKIRNG
ncbi:amino acid permease [Telmatocola sphagniphila]|uniref:Amino acid permease n=1 Tax=Telmatocola sphagniphila TaxID=1123043 RepID=A0A8E6B4A9_9BACT|nr:amino acid permease [Telmatocola sphagniphila]QVL31082.1 amino acid permease [Telmatocola sphagniphila]